MGFGVSWDDEAGLVELFMLAPKTGRVAGINLAIVSHSYCTFEWSPKLNRLPGANLTAGEK